MKYLLFFLVITCFFSCKKEEVMTYEGENGVAFYEYYQITNPRTYSFSAAANVAKVKDSVFVEMQVSGLLADYPRKIKIKAMAGTTAKAGIDYDFPEEITLPAGAFKTRYPIVVYKTPQMMLDTMILVVEPVATTDFKVGAAGTIPRKTSSAADEQLFKQLKLYINDMLTKPTSWNETAYGIFSSVKLRFMMKQYPTATANSFSTSSATRLPVLRAALTTYESTNGPLIDESNIRVTF
ncbi:DUF4843 domain-containing protein [Pedobacter sp. MC2016-14]|nr:DUF4843 domain-containing protein [Pedobacter sp. MC2016-14]MCD0489151.1 DUF4843 domain-containing protein [Pedobacter sp. MC2016-14]